VTFFASFASIVVALSMPYMMAASQKAATSPLDGVRTHLVDQINAHRRAYGLAPLVLDPLAERAAQLQAQYMELNGVMRHQDSDGQSPMQRYVGLGGHATMYGENVAYDGDDDAAASGVWEAVSKLDEMMMEERPPSDGHRENILSPDYTGIGIGLAVGSNGIYIAEDFVTP
jgi:uncharacterized protein YkwD